MSALGNEIRNVAREIRRSDTRAVLNHLASKVDDLAPDPKGTPTDDEQFAKSFGGWTPDEVARNPRAAAEVIERLRSRVIDGFRRTVQGEPTFTDVFADLPAPEGCPGVGVPTVQLMARLGGKTQAMIDQLLAQAEERGIRVEVVYPQGEPSDAQVLAALNAHYRVRLAQSEPMPGDPEVQGDARSLEEYSSKSIDRMRAALRAATQEGENR